MAELWGEILGYERIGVHDNFFELGGHSLLVARLLFKAQERFKVPLPVRFLFQWPTVAGLAQAIKDLRSAQTEGVDAFADTLDLPSEVVLDPVIHAGAATAESAAVPARIFLTGVTGFVGGFLLDELLRQTDADIYCLVRAASAEDAAKRIEGQLRQALLWEDDYRKRVIPIVGDLSQPLLGLSPARFEELAASMDVIYHNGALVNFLYPYAALRAPNVRGTEEVLRLACRGKLKPVHYVSTLGVLEVSRGGLMLEDDVTPHGPSSMLGYSQSKWVAEGLINIARSRGIPASIYRLKWITGHSLTGYTNRNDFVFRMIKGCVQLGAAPDFNHVDDFTPVDFACKAIVRLSQSRESWGKNFHLLNPERVQWSRIVDFMSSIGYTLRHVSFDQWVEGLSASTGGAEENAMAPLLSLFSGERRESDHQPSARREPLRFDYRNTTEGLAGTSIACPPVDDELLGTYFSYFIRSGLLEAPPTNAGALGSREEGMGKVLERV
jgi:thioester reductase-like protein